MEMPPRDLEKDKLVTFQVASYSYAQIGVIETGVCFLVWFMVYSFLFVLLTSVFKESYPIRTEAISFINMIIKKQTSCIKGNRDIYDELIKNFKSNNMFIYLNHITLKFIHLYIYNILLIFVFSKTKYSLINLNLLN